MKVKSLFMCGLALCATQSVNALEVYNNDNKKVEVYGNIRGYMMGSAAYRNADANTSGEYITTNRNWASGFNAGLQTNSRLGVKFSLGKFLGHIELGAQEPGLFGGNADLGLRLIYGQYNFGDMGKVTFGKTNTPTVVTGYVNDVMATDNGAWGFGALPISVRKFQLQYSIFGATLALIEDNPGELAGLLTNSATTGNRRVSLMPRIALAYDYKSDRIEAKAGLSYRYINTLGTGNNAIHTTTNAKNSFHILAAGKFNMLNKKLYISAILHYGLNANEERIAIYTGGYNHASIGSAYVVAGDINVTGGYAEAGFVLTDKISVRGGLGIQIMTARNGLSAVVSEVAMINAPIKVNNYINITPQIGYYGTGLAYRIVSGGAITSAYFGGFAGVIRAEFNF